MSCSSQPRVCILTTAHEPRDDRVFHKQGLSLAAAGYAVSLVGPWQPGEDSGPIRAVALPTFRMRLVRRVRGPWAALRLGLRERAAVYHFHDPELLPVGVALKLCGKHVIYDVHEDYSRKVRSRGLPQPLGAIVGWLVRAFERACALTFDHIVTADSHVAGLFPAHKTTVIANYPPRTFVEEPASGGVPGGRFRLAYVGGISRIRGIAKILEALDILDDPTIEFHLAGNVSDGELTKALKEHPRVVYHGVLPWEAVNALLRQADVGMLVLQPVAAFTYYPGENIIKLWEYLGLGLPVIISHFPKLEALIQKLDAGLPVDPTDAAGIAAAIRTLHENPGLRRCLGANGRQAVLTERNWEAEARKLVALYRQLVPVP